MGACPLRGFGIKERGRGVEHPQLDYLLFSGVTS